MATGAISSKPRLASSRARSSRLPTSSAQAIGLRIDYREEFTPLRGIIGANFVHEQLGVGLDHGQRRAKPWETLATISDLKQIRLF